jgi:hypothetical protein
MDIFLAGQRTFNAPDNFHLDHDVITKITIRDTPTMVIPGLRRWGAAYLGPRRDTATCASLLATGMFTDSQNSVGDDTLLNPTIVEVWCLFQHASMRRWSLAAAAGFGECRKSYR